MKKENKKIMFSIDIHEFEELKEAILEYFILMTDLLGKEDFNIETIEMNIDSDKIIVSGTSDEDSEEDSDESTEHTWEWI